MRASLLIRSLVGTALVAGAVASASAAPGTYYDPANAASSTGTTSGYELFHTIGCPGKGLFDAPCQVPPKPAPAPEPAPAQAPAPAPVVEPAPAPAPAPAAAPAPAPAPKKLVLHGVNFDHDKATLRKDASPVLDQAAADLKDWGDVKVQVAGYTDSRGSAKHNRVLSQHRAEAVRKYLISKGIAADRLTAKGYGPSNPIADNKTAAGRFKNRRVELVEQK